LLPRHNIKTYRGSGSNAPRILT